MTVDLLHNKIVKETLTEAFEKSVNDNLIPKLYSLYGVSLEGIQMYEDYIKDEFLKDGYWYYPLTVLLGEVNTTIWVKWDVSDKASFKDGNPYAYLGDGIDFSLADDVPFAFKNALEGRSTYYEGGYLKVNVTTDAPNVTFLAGKYSQTFIDEMSRQLSTAISKACGVVGIEDSSIEVDMVFAPNTYMEHTSDNVTYRRLLISAKGCAPRDFWIKWTRLNSSVAFSVNDNVNKDSILFEIGEDVSHKTREKEYRFLVYGNSDKYRVAMGRKSITEWRELIKRSVKRGELTKIVAGLDEDTRVNEVSDKLSEILEKCGVTVPALDNQVSETTNTELANEALRQAVLAEAEGDTEDILDTEPEKEDGAGDLFAEFPQAEFSFPEGLELTMNETDGSEDNFLLKNNTVSDEGEFEIEESESVFMTIEKPEPEVEEEPEQTVIDDMPDAKDASEAELGTDIDAVEEDTVSEEPELAAEEQTEEDPEESEEDVKEDTEEDAEEVEETADSVDSEERERLYAEIMSLKRALECEKLKNEKLEDEISLAQSRVERLENSLAETTGNDALLEESRAETVAARKERDELEKQLEFERIHSAELRSAMELGENTAEELAAAKLEIEKEKAERIKERFYEGEIPMGESPDPVYLFGGFSSFGDCFFAEIPSEGIELCDPSESFLDRWSLCEAEMKCDGGGFASYGNIEKLLSKTKRQTIRLTYKGKKYSLSTVSEK